MSHDCFFLVRIDDAIQKEKHLLLKSIDQLHQETETKLLSLEKASPSHLSNMITRIHSRSSCLNHQNKDHLDKLKKSIMSLLV